MTKKECKHNWCLQEKYVGWNEKQELIITAFCTKCDFKRLEIYILDRIEKIK